MCGIYGYIGDENASLEVLNGLRKLEYRGYDSWGIASVNGTKIDVYKRVGCVGDSVDLKVKDFNIKSAVGHTRWATHGGVTEVNAHPHYSTNKEFVVAQNGIVENYQELKLNLINKGYKFISQTDTEIIVRLLEEDLSKNPDRLIAVASMFRKLKGRNTIIVLFNDGHIIAVKNGSPLVIGVGDTNIAVSSDTLSFPKTVSKFYVLKDNEIVNIKNVKEHEIINLKSEKQIKVDYENYEGINNKIDIQGYSNFMIKEIEEQPFTIINALDYSIEELNGLIKFLRQADRVYVTGAGTASYSAGEIAFQLRKVAKLNAQDIKSYEIDGYVQIMNKNTLLIAVSQSGETADTIEIIEKARKQGVKIASIVNMVGSTVTRLSDYKFFSKTGPEISVVSTKAYTAQISWGLLIAHSYINKYEQFKKKAKNISKNLKSEVVDKLNQIDKKIIKKLKDSEHIFVLGRGQHYYTALEGGLKLKETSYKHAEGFAAGELKHGVISLIEKGTPVIVIIADDEHKDEMLSATAEVKARGATVIAIANENNNLFDYLINSFDGKEMDSIVKVIPFQYIAYVIAKELGYNPDRPRNLAKSVTVK